MDNKTHYICLDTCTWIYIVNGTEPVSFLRYIWEQLDKDNIKLILPELVIEEWNRNKNDTVKKGAIAFFKETLKSVERLLKIVGEESETPFIIFDPESHDDSLSLLRDKLKLKRGQVDKSVQDNIKMVENIFEHHNTILLKDSDKVRLHACDLAIKKKAPFIKKNSFADAMIVLSFIDFVMNKNINGAKFISYNTEDFCKKENGKKELHPDLEIFFKETSSQFYTVLGEALNSIEKNIATKEALKIIEELQNEEYDDYHACEECSGNRDGYGNYINSWHDIEVINECQADHSYSKYGMARAGSCEWCRTFHIKCPNCDAVTPLQEYKNLDVIECEGGCGMKFLVDDSNDIEGFGEHLIKIIDPRTMKCANCEGSFIDNLSTGICNKCELSYNEN